MQKLTFAGNCKKKLLNSIWKKITNWEQWPFKLVYAPLGFLWLYYAIKARTFWFSSNVNPTIEFSGIEGETKSEMYAQLPPGLYPATIYINAKTDFYKVIAALKNSKINYPFIVKPDVGMQGILFRKIENEEQLMLYHTHISVNYLIQELINLPLEFSVFHIRYPAKMKGKVTGFILKEYMFVEGDGQSTLLQLIQKHSKARARENEMRQKHKIVLYEILPKGKQYTLSIAGNHNRGAKFINLHNYIDQQLCNVFDKISNEAKEFYYGRYDIKCTSVDDLKAGKNFSILEFNGAGAEPNHIYDCGMSYKNALKEIARHWSDLYEIGKINNNRGIPYWSFIKGYRHMRNAAKFFHTLRKYDSRFL